MLSLRSQFPIFQTHPQLVYLDSAASTQTPQVVLDAMDTYYTEYRANIHRGLYPLSERASDAYEVARTTVASFLQAEEREIIFTSGTTHGLNMLARSLCEDLKPGDNIVLTRYEHHANLVPWQVYAKKQGVELRFMEIQDGLLDLESAQTIIDKKTKMVSFSLVSNVLGTVAPAKKLVTMAQKVGALSIIDAAQAVAHMPINVKDLDCDFLVFSAHKMYGPTGVGVLYGKKESLEQINPDWYGGGMIASVSYEQSSFRELPERLEGGTPNIAGVIGLARAVQFLEECGWEQIQQHEASLFQYFFEQKKFQESAMKIFGPKDASARLGVISFTLEDFHPHDVADILGHMNISVRAGHHCTEPLMQYLGVPGLTRISFGMYNTREDIDAFFVAIKKVKQLLQSVAVGKTFENSPLHQHFQDIA